MEKVEAYKTSDNLLFLDEEKARIHERNRKLNNLITELVEEVCWNGMDKDDVINFILSYIDKIIKVALD